ncbi:GA module [Gardnerella greenwoodii]|uniref:GA module n=1 Tax=Gardnerella greenwoodii TaxID=2914925 RepID=UPI0039EED62E
MFDKLVAENGVVVNTDGSATITFKDKTTRKIPANILVAKGESDSDKYKPKMPERTPVVKPSALTKEDKDAVLKAFKKANENNKNFNDNVKSDPDGIKFVDDASVSGGTKLVITYKDDSTLEISASELVYQGATIADWAPYVVPDTITVDNLKHLSDDDVTKIKNAFDTANQGITPYDEAKAQNGNNVPVTVDASTGAATITWKDGSTTTIEAWQFLKEKKKATPEPPAQEAEKEFIVEAKSTNTPVSFDPFKTSMSEIQQQNNVNKLNALKSQLKSYVKDSKTKNKINADDITIEYSVDNSGVGQVTFSVKGYTSKKTYPMGMFFVKQPNQHPNQQTTTVGPDSAGHVFIIKKYPIAGETPTDAEKKGALKQFIETNWNNATVDGNSDSYTGGGNWIPKQGTSGIGTAAKDGSGITTISVNASGDIVVKNNRGKEYSINHDSLYDKNSVSKDTTIADLKKQALALWNQKISDGLKNRDFKKAGIEDPTKYPGEINNINENETDVSQRETIIKNLRGIIQKLIDSKKLNHVFNTPTVEVDNPDSLTEDNLKAAIKAFLEANYDNASDVNVTSTSDFALPTNLTPKQGTVYMEVGADGVTKIKSASKDGIVVVDGDGTTTFTVKPTYTKKAAPEPAPKPGEKSKLDKMKEKAKEAIERNPNLTPADKEKFKKQVDDAHDANGVNTALNNANEQAKKNKNNTSDPAIQRQINNNKQGTTAQQQADDDKKKKDKEERDKKQKQQLQTDKTNAENTINNMPNLSEEDKSKLKAELNGDSTSAHPEGAKTPEAVKKILEKAKAINDAKGALQNDITKGALPFLDHGKGGDADKTDPDHADDAALNELLGTKSGKDATLTALDNALKADNATADSINTALNAAKRQNEINEANAKAAANAKLDALLQKLTDAENGLTAEQKNAVKDKVEAAKNAITTAQGTVKGAKKPSEIKSALDGVKIDDALKDINTQVSNAQKNNVKDPSQTQNGQLDEEKKKQIERINKSDLPEAEKQKAIKDIKAATKSGDPTAIANRYLKAKKIDDALKKIDDFKHLNDAQKDAFKAIINGTDAGNHTNDDGTTSDDIDDALANATATDTAMARLEELKKKANEFKDKADGKYSKLTNSDDDQNKKKAFDGYLKDATKLTTADQGDAKNADQVNELYKDLLNAMQAIDDKVKGAGVSTDALQAEVDKDSKLKPTQADPKTPGDSLYTTASKDKKDAFDQALTAAENALKTAKDDNANQQNPNTTPRTPEKEAQDQQAVDTALKNLQKAREELDGVNTKPLEQQIAKDADIKANVRYTNADTDKKQAYDKALKDAQDLIKNLTTTTAGGAAPQYGNITLDSKENKQKALDEALKALQKAYNELNGVAPAPTPAPTPAAVDKTALAAEIALDSNIGRRMSYIVSPSDKQLAYDRALSKARAVYADPSATQDDVNAALEALRAAARALSGYGSVDNDVNPLPSPLPTPVPGGHEGDSSHGFGVNDNAPTTVDKGELNVQIDSAEADSQPGNAGNGNAGNAGNTNAGNAGNNNASNANTNAANANSAAVNAAVENSPAVKQADAQVSKAQAALDAALAEAKKVAADPNATQAQVDAAAQKLSAARKALASAKAHAAEVRASVRAQVLKSGVSKLSKTGSNVSVFGLLATVAAAGAAFFVAKRRGISRHSNN